MNFRILGPLEAIGDRGLVPLTGGKQKALLAVLLLHADHVVSAERLVEDLWGEAFPGTAHKMVQIFVSQLRKQLPAGSLRTRAPGYVLDLDGHALDYRRFDEFVAKGRDALARGGAEQAARHFQNALALWRGPALAEFEEPFAGLESARLEEQRLACLEDRIEAELALGRHGELVGELDTLVRRHPYRERLRGQLMLALYRSGRHAEALASYQSFRRMLSEELGIDPPARLREFERRILQQDASLEFTGPDVVTAGAVSEREPAAAHFTAVPPGRERELTYLTRLSEEAFGGDRRLVFVTGEPGIGKTTIIESFVAQIRGGGRAAVALGQCVEHRGAGEPYLPVLEALGRLCRQEPDGQIVELLARQAPMWLSQMPWLVPDGELEAIRSRIVGATGERMLRELLEASDAIADVLPVVLVLEDLHWSDPSTIDLLEALARRREQARLLVVGTYRRGEATAQHHAVSRLEQRLRIRGLCAELAVGALGEEALEEYLAMRFGSQIPPSGLAGVLRERAGGNPLFVKTMLDAWFERGLFSHSGRGSHTELSVLAADMPQTVRQLIEQMFDDLDDEDRQLLDAASVAGRDFVGAAVAAACARGEEHVENRFEVLAADEQFLERTGETVWPDTTISARYRFLHDLYQEALYLSLPPARRARLHREIGRRLEHAYGERAREIASGLAAHYVRGGETESAIRSLQLAAEQALTRSGHREAIEHLTLALAQVDRLPSSRERAERELVLRITLGNALITARGYAAQETRENYGRARAVAAALGDAARHLLPVLYGLWNNELVAANHAAGYELASTFVRLAEQHNDDAVIVARRAVGWSLFFLGRLDEARDHFQGIAARYDPARHGELIRTYGEDPGIAGASALALCQWFLGLADQAVVTSGDAVERAVALNHPFTLVYALLVDAMLAQLAGDSAVAGERADAVCAIAAEYGIPVWGAWATAIRGWAISKQGAPEAGVAAIRRGLDDAAATGAVIFNPYFLVLLAEAHADSNHVDDGLRALEDGITAAESTDERYFEPELHRLRGELLLRLPDPHREAADRAFDRALELATACSAKPLLLRAAVSAARVAAPPGRATNGKRLLAEVYDSFTEGFNTHDLRAARETLAQLGA